MMMHCSMILEAVYSLSQLCWPIQTGQTSGRQMSAQSFYQKYEKEDFNIVLLLATIIHFGISRDPIDVVVK